MRMARLEPAGDLHGSGTEAQFQAGITLLSGVVLDQAALLGMLQRLYAFGPPILKVELVAGEDDAAEWFL
jgi:hypothetical protein